MDAKDIPQHNRAISRESIANINLNEEKPKAILLKSGARHCCLFSSYLFNIIFLFLAKAIRQLKRIKSMQMRREVKASLFADDTIVYISDLKTLPENSYS